MQEPNQSQPEQEMVEILPAAEEPEVLSAAVPEQTSSVEPQAEPAPEQAPYRPQAAQVPPQTQGYPYYNPYARPYYYPYGAPVPPQRPVPPRPPAQPRPSVAQKPGQEAEQAPKKKSKGGRTVLLILLAVAIAVASSITTGIVVGISSNRKMAQIKESMNAQIGTMQDQIDANNNAALANGQGLTPGQVYAQNVRAVVGVSCRIQNMDYSSGEFGIYESFGSGFIVSSDGYIVSNCHVVEGASEVRINTVDGEEYRAEVIGVDEKNDVSLLKIQAEGLPCVQIGSSDELAVGDQVVAIGNPLGELTSTLTVGYVSAKDRIVSTDGTAMNMLQTDAAINSGNSGGPLFNMKGEVIGITTAKYSGTTESGATIEGIGFAIPIDDVKSILEDLGEFGFVKSAYLGVLCRDVSQEAIRDGLPSGVYIEEVNAGSCAETAGLQRQDIIIGLGEYEITNMTDLTRALRSIEPGVETTITVYRGGQELELPIVLDGQLVTGETDGETSGQEPEEDGTGSQFPDFFGEFFG